MRIRWLSCIMICVALVMSMPTARAAENAATNYLLAIIELSQLRLPDEVLDATTDSAKFGFSTKISDRQETFIRQKSTVSILARFDQASIQEECDWGRYTSASWADAEITNKFHSLARVVLLRARIRYESHQWIEGNQDIEHVRLLARRMAQQARPWEHQCFMIENMAMHTAAAYLIQSPNAALEDLSQQNAKLGSFAPKEAMLKAEAERLSTCAKQLRSGQIPAQQLMIYLAPYLDGDQLIQSLQSSKPDELAGQVLGLADYLDELSKLMEGDLQVSMLKIDQLHQKYDLVNRIVVSQKVVAKESFLENAQGICRGKMFDAVIDRLRKGSHDFATIPDPYGKSNLRFQQETLGFTLISELRYFNHIDMQFGLAAVR